MYTHTRSWHIGLLSEPKSSPDMFIITLTKVEEDCKTFIVKIKMHEYLKHIQNGIDIKIKTTKLFQFRSKQALFILF